MLFRRKQPEYKIVIGAPTVGSIFVELQRGNIILCVSSVVNGILFTEDEHLLDSVPEEWRTRFWQVVHEELDQWLGRDIDKEMNDWT